MANYLPATYQPGWGYSGMGQQFYPQYSGQGNQPNPQMAQNSYASQQNSRGMDWVDGEAEAKGRQMPPGATQYAMWDINEPVIYIKSMNPMGMPNPLQKAHYTLENAETRKSGAAEPANSPEPADMGQYVKKEDMERMKQELMDAISGVNTGTSATKKTVRGE